MTSIMAMKPIIVKIANPIVKKCICGREYELGILDRVFQCSCGMRTTYVPNCNKAYYVSEAIDDSRDNQSIETADSVQDVPGDDGTDVTAISEPDDLPLSGSEQQV